MNVINNSTVVKEQYKTASNLSTRISIHAKYSTNKTSFGDWIVSNYRIKDGMRILELGCGTGDMWKEHLDLLGNHTDSDLVDYIYSLSSMSHIGTIPREELTRILEANMVDGMLRVPKEYGMFVAYGTKKGIAYAYKV